MKHVLVLTLTGIFLGQAFASSHSQAGSVVESNLSAGVAKVDITPPPDTRVTGHPRKTAGARDPIRAGVLLLDDGKTKVAIATFDLIGATDSLVKSVREAIHSQAEVPVENILVAASHNHSGPDFDKEPAWAKVVIEQIGTAAAKA